MANRLNYRSNGLSGMETNFTISENYSEAHEPIQSLSIINEPNVKYTRYENYISISSSNRDTDNYPKHYDYTINFDQPYKNIKYIELISAVLPNVSGILDEPYLAIDIDEINYIEFPNNKGSANLKAFSILPLKTPVKLSGGFINPELGLVYHKKKVFKTPLASLSKFNVKIRDYTGNLYTFGNSSGSTDKALQHHFVFKITTEEVSRENVRHRNVY